MKNYTIFLIGADETETLHVFHETGMEAIHQATDELYERNWAEIAVVRDPFFALIHTHIKRGAGE